MTSTESLGVARPKTLPVERGLVIEYVGGAKPYLWIGTPRGEYVTSVSVRELREFLKGRRS